MFISFSRLLVKDEIKKGSFQLNLGVGKVKTDPWSDIAIVTDYGAANSYKVNSPAGEYAVLYATGAHGVLNQPTVGAGYTADNYAPVGLIYYQAGVVVLTSSLFSVGAAGEGLLSDSAILQWHDAATSFTGTLISNEISSSADALRHRIQTLSFNNTTELNSTIYFCRANHNEFNFSSNPTYLDQSKIRVKAQSSDSPVAYITTVGLYSADNVLLAVAKLSEPLRKDPTIEYTLRVRLDY